MALVTTHLPLLQVLSFVKEVLGDAVSIKLHLNPRLDLSDMPLKSFYRLGPVAGSGVVRGGIKRSI